MPRDSLLRHLPSGPRIWDSGVAQARGGFFRVIAAFYAALPAMQWVSAWLMFVVTALLCWRTAVVGGSSAPWVGLGHESGCDCWLKIYKYPQFIGPMNFMNDGYRMEWKASGESTWNFTLPRPLRGQISSFKVGGSGPCMVTFWHSLDGWTQGGQSISFYQGDYPQIPQDWHDGVKSLQIQCCMSFLLPVHSFSLSLDGRWMW